MISKETASDVSNVENQNFSCGRSQGMHTNKQVVIWIHLMITINTVCVRILTGKIKYIFYMIPIKIKKNLVRIFSGKWHFHQIHLKKNDRKVMLNIIRLLNFFLHIKEGMYRFMSNQYMGMYMIWLKIYDQLNVICLLYKFYIQISTHKSRYFF